MLDIGVGMILAFMVALCMGGLVAWGWTINRLWNRLPIYPPESRLVANWGFAEVLLCLGVYILLTGLLAVVLMQAGFQMGPQEVVKDVATAVISDQPVDSAVASSDAVTSTDAVASSDAVTSTDAVPSSDAEADNPKPLNPERLGALITIDGVARMMTIVIVLGLLFLQDRRIVERIGWLPRWRDIALGMVASCMLLPLVFAIQAGLSNLVPYEHAVLEIITVGPPAWVLFAMAFTSMIVAPMVEEFFFRGVLQGWFQRLAAPSQTAAVEVESTAAAMNRPMDGPYAPPASENNALPIPEVVDGAQIAGWPWWPIIVSSLLFALVHVGQGAAPIALFFLALGLGYLYRITGRLWASITVHFVLNSISTLMTVLGS